MDQHPRFLSAAPDLWLIVSFAFNSKMIVVLEKEKDVCFLVLWIPRHEGSHEPIRIMGRNVRSKHIPN